MRKQKSPTFTQHQQQAKSIQQLVISFFLSSSADDFLHLRRHIIIAVSTNGERNNTRHKLRKRENQGNGGKTILPSGPKMV